jgi:hypothetical protein
MSKRKSRRIDKELHQKKGPKKKARTPEQLEKEEKKEKSKAGRPPKKKALEVTKTLVLPDAARRLLYKGKTPPPRYVPSTSKESPWGASELKQDFREPAVLKKAIPLTDPNEKVIAPDWLWLPPSTRSSLDNRESQS